ncbi:MAG: DUF4062 domain-containing protein [Armatimonadetes bacterium]|nr:DUF4062 domain-containing protein [Armatimonadota bacterium]
MSEPGARVFVCSTAYDLIDLRAEVEAELRDMGLTPVMSDSRLDGFEIVPNKDSIETCLVNVRSSNYLLLILSRRYGPSLKSAGYPDVSAFHLEYDEAVKCGMRPLVYARDRLVGDWAVWRKQKDKTALELPWTEKKDYRLLQFLQEHAKLDDASRSNWYQTYSSSTDLRQLIAKDLKRPAQRHALTEAIRANLVPMFSAALALEAPPPRSGVALLATCSFTNCGTVPAYNLTLRSRVEEFSREPAIAPGGKTRVNLVFREYKVGFTEEYTVEYYDTRGVQYADVFAAKISSTPGPGHRAKYSIWLKSRKYKLGGTLELDIEG